VAVSVLRTVEEISRASGGYACEDETGAVYIPLVWMREPGRGNGGRFLDALPRDRTIKFPTVMSARLREMLERRGYEPVIEWSPEIEEYVEVYVREPSASA
jgi:hypothetical protein